MDKFPFIPYAHKRITTKEMESCSTEFLSQMSARRSVRMFDNDPVPKVVIENIILTASSAPSGAHKQPWTFCAVSDMEIKRRIRSAAEEEEKINYGGRMSDSWLQDLAPFETDWEKPFLEVAPWLIVVFKKSYDIDAGGKKLKNYYVNESVGIATGLLLTAIHQAGLACLTHTPSPLNFLEKILQRPKNEKAYLLIPVGLPAKDATVPDLKRKELSEVAIFY
ncbi:MAG: nitroreductase family protein [Saprospiraceae bacterium]|nr:nitroreductase family protein [Saprospiraceae bacterium]